MPLYIADEMPPQPTDLVEMEAETIMTHSDLNRGQALTVLCWVGRQGKRQTLKNSTAVCKEGRNWQGEEQGSEQGRAHASCHTLLQCLLGSGTGGDEGAALWPYEEVQTAKKFNCIWNSPGILLDSVFIAWLVTTSLLWVITRRRGTATPSPSPWSLRTAAMDGMLFLTLLCPTQSKAEHWDW